MARSKLPEESWDNFHAHVRQAFLDGDRTCMSPGCNELGRVVMMTTVGELPVCLGHGKPWWIRELGNTEEEERQMDKSMKPLIELWRITETNQFFCGICFETVRPDETPAVAIGFRVTGLRCHESCAATLPALIAQGFEELALTEKNRSVEYGVGAERAEKTARRIREQIR